MDYSRYSNLKKGINRKRRIAKEEKRLVDIARGSVFYEMTLDEFKEKYKATEYDDSDAEFVAKQNPDYIWTWIDPCDGYGTEYIYSGLHRVNRVGYFITKELNNKEGFGIEIKIKKEFNWDMSIGEFIKDIDAKPNHIHPENGYIFKNTPEELEFLKAQDETYIFTYYHPNNNSWGFTGYLLSELIPSDEPMECGEFIFKGYFVARNLCHEGETTKTIEDEEYK